MRGCFEGLLGSFFPVRKNKVVSSPSNKRNDGNATSYGVTAHDAKSSVPMTLSDSSTSQAYFSKEITDDRCLAPTLRVNNSGALRQDARSNRDHTLPISAAPTSSSAESQSVDSQTVSNSVSLDISTRPSLTNALPVSTPEQSIQAIIKDKLVKVGDDGSPVQTLNFRVDVCVSNPDKALDEQDGRWEEAILDTQSRYNIIFRSVAEALELKNHTGSQQKFKGLGRPIICSQGKAIIKLTFDGRPEREIIATAYIIEDRDVFNEDEKPPFKILLGSHTISEYGLIEPNRKLMPNIMAISVQNT